MLDRAQNVRYTENLAIRAPEGGKISLGHLVIRRTDIYRLRNVTRVTLTLLEPQRDEVFLFSTLSLPIDVTVGSETSGAQVHEVVIVNEPRVEIWTPIPTDVIVAVSQACVIEEMGLRADEPTPSIRRLAVNRLVGLPLIAGLTQAFDLVEAGTVSLDPRVLDFLHVLGRSAVHLPHDVETDDADPVPLLARVRALIAALHTDPELTPAGVADALGIPLRTVQRTLSAEGTSIANELRVARARTARSLQDSDAGRASGIARVARDAGFGSVSSMRRALRELDAREIG